MLIVPCIWCTGHACRASGALVTPSASWLTVPCIWCTGHVWASHSPRPRRATGALVASAAPQWTVHFTAVVACRASGAQVTFGVRAVPCIGCTGHACSAAAALDTLLPSPGRGSAGRWSRRRGCAVHLVHWSRVRGTPCVKDDRAVPQCTGHGIRHYAAVPCPGCTGH